VPGSAAAAPRFVSGSRTKTIVPVGASTSLPPTVKVARPATTTYSSSCPDGFSSCSAMIVPSGSAAVHALMPNACTPSSRRIGAQPSGRASSAIVAVS
jgi:hypothetical protein